ncbi:uncharacterized protein LOC108481077 [Gossypium arboreum]|uniref:uncharacterized protein LOC108481077 n=1 Tax=Gossypium arboreum TaxID=29729 RepID=UPI0008194F8C|nr:uncharacterized protein LOC108481077 [Gossypium arboreum]
MSVRGIHDCGTRGRGNGCRGTRAEFSSLGSMSNLDTSETPILPPTETGSQDRIAGDKALSQAILRILERVAGPNTGSGARGGVTRVAPNVAEHWMEAIERIMDDLDCTPKKKLKGAVSLLRDEAYQWWLNVKEGTQPNRFSWEFFKSTFQGKYMGGSYIDARRREFLNLTQGDRLVAYEVKIIEEVKSAERQNKDREKGKNKRDSEPSTSVQRPKKKAKTDMLVRDGPPVTPTGLQPYGDCGRLHQGKCWRRTGACLMCGSLEYRIWECSLRADQARGGNSMGHRQRAPGRDTGQSKARQSALVYAAHRREDRDAPEVITGTILIYDVPYFALIDIGSTHSYVASTVFENLWILVESTSSEVIVLSPLGKLVQVSKLYRDVPLEVQGSVFLANLMELSFGDFDLILDMDWLVKYCVSLDYVTKRVILRTEEDNEVVMIGECQNYLANVISALVAEKLVRKGCETFLVYISVSVFRDSSVNDIKTVRDFLDVFPEELLGLPLNREVESGIKLFPGTAPVSIAPYCMTPKELTELKAQL